MDEPLPMKPLAAGAFSIEASAGKSCVLCLLPAREPAPIAVPSAMRLMAIVLVDENADSRAAAEAVAAQAKLPKMAIYAGYQLEDRQAFGPLGLKMIARNPDVLSASWATRSGRAVVGARIDLAKLAQAEASRGLPITHVVGGVASNESAAGALRALGLPRVILHAGIAGFDPAAADSIVATGAPVEIVGAA